MGYRLVVIGPDDEVLDTIPLDGLDLTDYSERESIGSEIETAMGSDHVAACARLIPAFYTDGEED